MTEEIYPKVTDEGAMGARLDVFSRPRGCPGLGGWKRQSGGMGWWTRVKGQEAERILRVARDANDKAQPGPRCAMTRLPVHSEPDAHRGLGLVPLLGWENSDKA